ncbi:hypothetical protein HBB16_02995 [Pseudonocardia sp. MCCB 268]|nr:hypothetical protein [Pseudonocardia cytotoxica]
MFVAPAAHRRRADADRQRLEPPLGWCLELAGEYEPSGSRPHRDRPRHRPRGLGDREFLALGRDLKEAVAWSPGAGDALARATVLDAGRDRPGKLAGTGPRRRGHRDPADRPGSLAARPEPGRHQARLVSNGRRTGTTGSTRTSRSSPATSRRRPPFASAAGARLRRGTRSGCPGCCAALDVGAVGDAARRSLASDVGCARHKLRGRGCLDDIVMTGGRPAVGPGLHRSVTAGGLSPAEVDELQRDPSGRGTPKSRSRSGQSVGDALVGIEHVQPRRPTGPGVARSATPNANGQRAAHRAAVTVGGGVQLDHDAINTTRGAGQPCRVRRRRRVVVQEGHRQPLQTEDALVPSGAGLHVGDDRRHVGWNR